MTEPTEKIDKKKNKKKGPIRYEAIVPVLVLSLLTYIYFSFYFDHHMRKLIEYVGTQANGAEVNVGTFRTSFLTGSLDIDHIQVTNPEKPTHNSIQIENIHFKYLWDALLRMKFVVEDASINTIQLMSPRKSPGKVLPPQPAKPGKIDELQLEVMAQVKKKYGGNVLSNLLEVLEGGGNYEEQLQKIRETLKSEARVNAMIAEVNQKKEFWDKRVNVLSDTSKIKEIEATINQVQKEKNFLNQAQAVGKLNNLLKDVEKQYKAIDKASDQLQAEIKTTAQYPKELQALVNEDIKSLKNRFSIPQVDFKDMALHLFAGEFAQYIAKARKYQAVAEQYLPEKKKEEEPVIPPKRSEGKNYDFPITTGYPLFWLKRAAISSKGTADSYAGQVAGELTNVTTSPKQIKKPVVLNLQGDFPAAKMNGVKAVLTADFTREVGKQSAFLQVNSFAVPQKMFIDDKNLRFGFLDAVGSTTITADLVESKLKMNWNSNLLKPKFLVETNNKLAKEILNNAVNSLPVISIDGSATGTFSNLNMSISSNLGQELGAAFTRELGAKVTEAQDKINTLVEEKINKPKEQLMAALSGNTSNLKDLGNLEALYKKNEDRIQAEIKKLKSGGGAEGLKEKGKKIFKGIKF